VFSVNRNPSLSELRKFGWVLLLGFGVIGLIAWSAWFRTWDFSGTWNQVFALVCWALGLVLGGLSLVSVGLARPIYVGWMTLFVPIGIAMSTVLLTVLFFLFLPVFSLIVRFGDPLRKKLRAHGSYWEDPRKHEPTLERTKRPF